MSSENKGLCPRTGQYCEARDACETARETARSELKSYNSFSSRLLLLIGASQQPRLIAERKDSVAAYEVLEEELNVILDTNCGEYACVIDGALELPQNEAAAISISALRAQPKVIMTN